MKGRGTGVAHVRKRFPADADPSCTYRIKLLEWGAYGESERLEEMRERLSSRLETELPGVPVVTESFAAREI